MSPAFIRSSLIRFPGRVRAPGRMSILPPAPVRSQREPIISTLPRSSMLCLSRGNNLSNFAFQARVTIVKGSFAGLCFRVNSSGTRFYRFALDANQDYYAFEVANTGLYSLLFTEDRKVDLNQSYLVTVIAVGSHFYFYLDGHYITDVIDPSNTLGSGAIGLTAGSSIGPSTEAVFSNVEVWKL